MTVDLQTIMRLKKSILENIEVATVLHKEKLYQEFAYKNRFLQEEIVFNSIAYAKTKENADNIQHIINNYASESDNELILSDDIPDSLIIELFNYVEIMLERQKEHFQVSHSQVGRYDLLFKGALQCVKLLKNNIEKQNKNFEVTIIPGIIPVNLEQIIKINYNKIIDSSVSFCIRYEADSQNYKMCREVLSKNFTSHYKYQYKLDKKTQARLQQDIDLVVHNYTHKNQYTGNLEFEEYRNILKDTMDMAQKTIHNIIEDNPSIHTKDFRPLIKIYETIFQNSKERFKSSRKTSAIFQTLKGCNMNHRMHYDDKIIFPFLFDLIVMSFAFSIAHTKYKDTYTDSNKVAKAFNDYKYAYVERDTDENYYFNEFARATEEIPKEYKKLDDPTILAIKHYSEMLDCDYKTLASLFRQLRFQFPDHEKAVYNLLLPQRNIDLNFDDDYFRKLSLFII